MNASDLEDVYTSEADGETVSRAYACPFYIRNSQYARCVRIHHLTSIEDVKDHVCRDHRQPCVCLCVLAPLAQVERLFLLTENREFAGG
jgi:hypothetical protein